MSSPSPAVYPHIPSSAPVKKQRVVGPTSHTPPLHPELGKFITRDVNLLSKLGWCAFVKHRRRRGDIASLQFLHPATPLLQHLKHQGAPVVLASKPWTCHQTTQAMHRGPHRSCHNHIQFLEEEFVDMIQKDQWAILPYSIAQHLPNLRISPPGVVPQRNRRPRWIGDYTWSGVNDDTQPLAPSSAMQFGHALERFLRELLLANPSQGPISLLKIDIADGFYRINVNPADIPKLALAFPTRPGQDPLVALPLVLPMGWKSSPAYFSAATETAADLANQALLSQLPQPTHPLESHAAAMDAPDPSPFAVPSAPAPPAPAPHKLHIASAAPSSNSPALGTPTTRDPCLPSNPTPVAYVDVFVDDFIALCQGSSNEKARVRQTLLHSIDKVFRPNDFYDSHHRREPISLKKLRQGDSSWNTTKQILGWTINTIAMTISLPPHRVQRLHDLLTSIPPQQKRTSVKKWHKLLGELRSMSLALPGSRNLFSAMQLALSLKTKSRINLSKGVHSALQDFRWLHHNISNRPTRIAELIPLHPCALGYHDASGRGAGGVWFPTPDLTPRLGIAPNTPLLWRYAWPPDITSKLITPANPHGTITNSDLELAGGLLHLDILAQSYDTRERTILSKTDNLATMFWQRKGSATTASAPAHLLRLFGIHQRFHRYVPRHDYIPGPSNPMADDASRLLTSSDPAFVSLFNHKYPQKQSFKLVTPTLPATSSVTSALLRKMCSLESLLVVPPLPTPIGPSGLTTPLSWASTPFSKPSRTKYQSYKSSSDEFALANLQPSNVQSSLGQLKTTYGQLHRRTLQWGPQTPALMHQEPSISESLEC